MSEYVGWLEKLHAGIGWARQEFSERLFGLFSVFGNFTAGGAEEANFARLPTYAAPSALIEIGHNNGSARYYNENDAQYRVRMREAHPRALERGTRQGVLRELEILGLDNALLYEDFEWGRGPKPYWSQFWIVLLDDDTHTYPQPVTIGASLTIGGEWVLGSGYTPLEVSSIRRAILETRRASVILRSVIIGYDDALVIGTPWVLGSGAIIGAGSIGGIGP